MATDTAYAELDEKTLQDRINSILIAIEDDGLTADTLNEAKLLYAEFRRRHRGFRIRKLDAMLAQGSPAA